MIKEGKYQPPSLKERYRCNTSDRNSHGNTQGSYPSLYCKDLHCRSRRDPTQLFYFKTPIWGGTYLRGGVI